MLAEFTARNNTALHTLVNKHQVKLRSYPDDVLSKLRALSDQVVKEVANKSKETKQVYDSFIKFRDQAKAWHDVSEAAFMRARTL